MHSPHYLYVQSTSLISCFVLLKGVTSDDKANKPHLFFSKSPPTFLKSAQFKTVELQLLPTYPFSIFESLPYFADATYAIAVGYITFFLFLLQNSKFIFPRKYPQFFSPKGSSLLKVSGFFPRWGVTLLEYWLWFIKHFLMLKTFWWLPIAYQMNCKFLTLLSKASGLPWPLSVCPELQAC